MTAVEPVHVEPVHIEPVPVLLWHGVGEGEGEDPFRVSSDSFRRQLDLVLASGRQPLTADEYGEVLTGSRPAPQRPVVLTFDDGFADLTDEVRPALRDRGLRGTAFVTTGFVGRPGMLSRAGLDELAQDGPTPTIEIGSHSITHPHLDLLPPPAAHREIAGSGRTLEDWLGVAVSSFAYPHGNHSRRTRAIAVQAGYRTVHAVRNALSHPEDDVYAVSRYTVRADTPDSRVAEVLAGRGAPLGWRRERLRTWGFRQFRRARYLVPAGARS
jgi:peptidoglycan/xylan/chitin deacetylase (PgdA/CDA1 family)